MQPTQTTAGTQPGFSPTGAIGKFVKQIKTRILILILFVGSIWGVFGLQSAFPGWQLEAHGVVPRTLSGLQGILFAPWLHANYGHIMSNTTYLIILGWLCMWPRLANFWEATFGSMVGAGLCAWLVGSAHSVHFGASGVVFGYAGYLIGRGFYSRNFVAMLVTLFVVGFYGFSLFFGLLPIYPGVSWQSHVGGAIGGFLTARLSVASKERAAS